MKNKIINRLYISFMLLFLYLATVQFYQLIQSPVHGAANAQLLTDNVASWARFKFVSEGGITSTINIVFLALVGLTWLTLARRQKSRTPLIAALLASGMLTACSPVKVLDVVEIKPNETAWAIPLDAASQSGQVKFNSVDFLNNKKVASKRIMVDKVERSVGRMWYDIEWIPAVRVIKVDRSLITKQWTAPNDIGVVTKDSVQVRVGLTITASIDEDDSSTYLYYHGENPLANVMDANIRSFAVAELTRRYSELTLADAQTKGTEIYADLQKDAAIAFKAKGITVQYLGNAEGLTYADANVQNAINKSYQAGQDAKTAEMEQNAQKVRNQTKVMTTLAEAQAEQGAQEVRNKVKIQTAEAEATAARSLLAAKDATLFQNDLTIRLLEAQAQMKMASTWNGAMPANILPANSPMLLNMGK